MGATKGKSMLLLFIVKKLMSWLEFYDKNKNKIFCLHFRNYNKGVFNAYHYKHLYFIVIIRALYYIHLFCGFIAISIFCLLFFFRLHIISVNKADNTEKRFSQTIRLKSSILSSSNLHENLIHCAKNRSI